MHGTKYINSVNRRYAFADKMEKELGIKRGEFLEAGFWYVNGNFSAENLRNINRAKAIREHYRDVWARHVGLIK